MRTRSIFTFLVWSYRSEFEIVRVESWTWREEETGKEEWRNRKCTEERTFAWVFHDLERTIQGSTKDIERTGSKHASYKGVFVLNHARKDLSANRVQASASLLLLSLSSIVIKKPNQTKTNIHTEVQWNNEEKERYSSCSSCPRDGNACDDMGCRRSARHVNIQK